MSYYSITYEVPNDLLEKLKKVSPDDEQMEKLFYDWKNTTPKRDTTFNVMEAPFRVLTSGKYFADYEPDEHEKRFSELLHKADFGSDLIMVKFKRKPLSNGYPGISNYQEPAELALIWKRLEIIIAQYPEYAVTDLLAPDPYKDIIEIQADASSLEEWIKFHYGCAMRGSATITIDS